MQCCMARPFLVRRQDVEKFDSSGRTIGKNPGALKLFHGGRKFVALFWWKLMIYEEETFAKLSALEGIRL